MLVLAVTEAEMEALVLEVTRARALTFETAPIVAEAEGARPRSRPFRVVPARSVPAVGMDEVSPSGT